MKIKQLTREEIKDRRRKIQMTNKMMGTKCVSPRPTTRAAALAHEEKDRGATGSGTSGNNDEKEPHSSSIV